jgi:hypothetical protein
LNKLFKTIDALITVRDAVVDKGGATPDDTSVPEAARPGLGGPIEARLTNLLVVALKEAFDRDHTRLELERARMEDERRRAEEAAQQEARRQAADREAVRLRFLAGSALAGWVVSVMLLLTRAGQMTGASMMVLAAGSALLLGSLGAAFTAQARVSAYAAGGDPSFDRGTAGVAALWLLIAGLALSAASMLV